MTLADAFNLFAQPVFSSIQMIAAMALFCWRQPRRENYGVRAVLVIAVYLAATVAATYIGYVAEPRLMEEWSFPTQILLNVAITFIWVGLILFCHEVSVWAAVFLVVAGLSTYHTMTGVMGLSVVIAGGMGILNDVESTRIAVFPIELNPFVVMANIVSTVGVYALCDLLFARNLKGEWVTRPNDKTLAIIFAVAIFIDAVFNISMMSTYNYGLPIFQRTVFGLTKTLFCFFLLYVEFQFMLVERLQADMALSERMLTERARQYQMSRENIDAINFKCHDIRHQIRHLQDGAGGAVVDPAVLADIAREVDVFDASVETGNDALDTILTEKSLVCGRDGITLSCIADGASLDFMPPAEIYSLFGNILDNAIEAVSAVSDEGKRAISLVVQRKGDMVSIHEENYFTGEIAFKDGLPQTSKVDTVNHGFGVRSIRAIVERHDGSFAVGADGELFHADALIPLP